MCAVQSLKRRKNERCTDATPRGSVALVVEAQEIVHGEVEFGDGRSVVESGVRSVPVVAVEPGGEMGGAMCGVGVDGGIGPIHGVKFR